MINYGYCIIGKLRFFRGSIRVFKAELFQMRQHSVSYVDALTIGVMHSVFHKLKIATELNMFQSFGIC